MKTLKGFSAEANKCVRCGTCRSVCPTFKAIGRETASARGKLALISAYIDGKIGLNEAYVRHVKECTLCGACRANCPSGVDTTGVFAAARADIAKAQGVPFAASFLFRQLLNSGGQTPFLLKLFSRFQGVLFRDASIEKGLLSRFPLPLVGGGRLMPRFAETTFLELPRVEALGGAGKTARGRATVAFYAGCGINFLMPEIGLKSLDVLKSAGASVIVPSGQICCGMPAYSSGDVETAREMAIKNLEVFEKAEFDFIATSCATCGYGLKTLFNKLLGGEPEFKERVERISSRVRDITELLVNELNFTVNRNAARRDAARTVVYHDPCHLGRAQGVREEPRRLIEMGEGVRLKEMKNPCACCGLGGGLTVSNYELSVEIARKKAENIKNSNAEIVATACPGCMVQLRDALHRFKVNAEVRHVVELL